MLNTTQIWDKCQPVVSKNLSTCNEHCHCYIFTFTTHSLVHMSFKIFLSLGLRGHLTDIMITFQPLLGLLASPFLLSQFLMWSLFLFENSKYHTHYRSYSADVLFGLSDLIFKPHIDDGKQKLIVWCTRSWAFFQVIISMSVVSLSCMTGLLIFLIEKKIYLIGIWAKKLVITCHHLYPTEPCTNQQAYNYDRNAPEPSIWIFVSVSKHNWSRNFECRNKQSL